MLPVQKGALQIYRPQMTYKGLAGRCAVIDRREPCRQIGRKWHIRGLLVDVPPVAGEDYAGR